MASMIIFKHMKNLLIFALIILFAAPVAKATGTDTTFITPFERSNGTQTATYLEAFDFYKKLRDSFPTIAIGDVGLTDIGYPLRYVSYTSDANYDKDEIKKEGRHGNTY